ncbi:3-hydroxyacyl-CoA dehydrogenase NAD-binding domain-containing protein [Nitratireductor thuwali]|uniref:Fatty acid oxidation complex subunit alpha n=1 Tax=Nitratireductor thuwali TaxID=2267699 RepID=A0ABY5MN47_9HYPH|nr:Fatty acid oxidation complex subunit alpha [Nitratireductor thuwali]
MADTVSVTRQDGVAVVWLDNPPVNALGHALRQPLHAMLEKLRADADTAAIVIACKGRTFVAGADISEFGQPPKAPSLPDVIALLESIGKPTVAAIHGNALGGGFELALGCHYRIAAPDARVGLPEVTLGLLPGAGGTVRLPRLVGAREALGVIVSGKPVNAEKALALGAIDAIAEGDLVAEAVSFARARAEGGGPHVPVLKREEKIEAARNDLDAFEETAKAATANARGLTAPLRCTEAVRNAILLEPSQALAREREMFVELRDGEESAALRHLFFAEREAVKVEGVGKDVAARPVRHVGIVGAGTMGGGIAMAFANGGMRVTVLEVGDEALQRGLGQIEKNYAGSVSRGSLSEKDKLARLARIRGTTDYTDMSDCDLIVEAVFEEMGVKRKVFEKLDEVARDGAVLASNTSYLDLDAIAAFTKRPSDVVGLHFFSPAHVMRLLEIVRGERTAPEVLATALSVAKAIGKTPVVVGVCDGFVGNRMLAARREENEALLLEGASPSSVDKAFTDFGWPMGPFQMVDLAGLDISWRHRQSQGLTAPVADSLCELGYFGQKTGRGFYRYDEGARKPVPDPFVEELIEAKSRELGIERRAIGAEEILERTMYPMINEGARILEEGIAARASDIDVVWVNGYGFPRGKGGPMFWARRHGIDKILARLEYWHGVTGKPVYRPARKLVEAAAAASW